MNKREKIVGEKTGAVSKTVIYIMLVILTITIVIPVAWVFMASVKQNSEFYGNPFALPQGFYLQNFVDAWTKARMGDYFFTSVMITAIALAILLIVALPASYVLSRYKFRGSKLLNTCFMAGLFINVSYIVVPIFLMFVSGDKIVKSIFEMCIRDSYCIIKERILSRKAAFRKQKGEERPCRTLLVFKIFRNVFLQWPSFHPNGSPCRSPV